MMRYVLVLTVVLMWAVFSTASAEQDGKTKISRTDLIQTPGYPLEWSCVQDPGNPNERLIVKCDQAYPTLICKEWRRTGSGSQGVVVFDPGSVNGGPVEIGTTGAPVLSGQYYDPVTGHLIYVYEAELSE